MQTQKDETSAGHSLRRIRRPPLTVFSVRGLEKSSRVKHHGLTEESQRSTLPLPQRPENSTQLRQQRHRLYNRDAFKAL